MKRKGDFGSTNAEIFGAKKITDDKPTLVMTFEDGRKLEGMLDSGADVTVVASHRWPMVWQKHCVNVTFSGMGVVTDVQQNVQTLQCSDPDGDTAVLQPYIAPIAITLWGRDLLQKLGVRYIKENGVSQQSPFKFGPLLQEQLSQ